jgi:hypothetical protein
VGALPSRSPNPLVDLDWDRDDDHIIHFQCDRIDAISVLGDVGAGERPLPMPSDPPPPKRFPFAERSFHSLPAGGTRQ